MTWHIHIKGQVQGVGFRPHVFIIALRLNLKGWVNNTDDGVHIVFNADENLALDFLNEVKTNAPKISRITSAKMFHTLQIDFDDFQIKHSKKTGKPNLLITPDLSICGECREEINENINRRRSYSFTTCTNCGPRYSISKQLPYDRNQTTMDSFNMCNDCCLEYKDPLNRRYYSQTNSCPGCGVELSLYDNAGTQVKADQEEILNSIVTFWEEGKIVALKGIGGFVLTCDASNATAVLELRKRKHRPSKPFAVMFPSDNLFNDYQVSEQATEMLNNEVSPIVLLEILNKLDVVEEVAPGLSQLGVMMPYTPLYDILLNKFGKPIVATSANISNSPIIYQDEEAHLSLTSIADYILTNNRRITIPQDDSVIKFTNWKNSKIVIRRSRGLAPTYINPNLGLINSTILGMGAMLKSTFSLLTKSNTYVSQYLGDLENYDTQQNYQSMIDYFVSLLNVEPNFILCDKHTGYHSSAYAEDLATRFGVPVIPIQHHIAHFGAVIGEHNLVHSTEPILGIIWDGTGLGDDGNIWGGEFFKYSNLEFIRSYHFEYFDFVLGDKMPKEPRISALSACWDVMGSNEYLQGKFDDNEWKIYSKLLDKDNPLKTSSVGRIFDAVASILDIKDVQSYEGEAAMRLESTAMKYFAKNGLEFDSSYFMEGAHYYRIPTKSLMTNIVLDLHQGKSKEYIAAKFHYSLACLVKIVANNLKIKKLAFSGGVFQNGLLVDLIIHYLGDDFELFFHKELSPNDENISFGQLVCFQIEQHKEVLLNNKTNEYVSSNSR